MRARVFYHRMEPCWLPVPRKSIAPYARRPSRNWYIAPALRRRPQAGCAALVTFQIADGPGVSPRRATNPAHAQARVSYWRR